MKRIMNAKDICEFFAKMQDGGVWIFDPANKIQMKIKHMDDRFYIKAINRKCEEIKNCEIIIRDDLNDHYGFKINILGSEITIPTFLEESVIDLQTVQDNEILSFFREAEEEIPKESYYANLSEHSSSLFLEEEYDIEYFDIRDRTKK